MNTQNRQPAGVPTGGQFAASVRAESDVALTQQPNPAERVTFDWEPDGSGAFTGSSSSGWGSKATIIPPDAGDGETFYWEVRQGGWTWDGREASLEAAQVSAASEANRMLSQQENEPGGFDWDADDEDDDWGGW